MPDDDEVVAAAIYPAIGIGRVGNSPDAYFFGPEIPGPHPRDDSNFRDRAGRIKRQAARFRLYGLNRRGVVVRELTANDAKIEWRVHVANSKAAWYNFEQALDIPASQGKVPHQTYGIANIRRNAAVPPKDRSKLGIDPGPRTIAGVDINADGSDRRYALDTGKFFDRTVYLGELRTDGAGHLIVLGGRGTSASANGLDPTQFANNDTWYDDASDGPVDAHVDVDGKSLPVTGAWVIVAPPNYAPGIQSIITGYDLVLEAAIALDVHLQPARPSFCNHIYPLLRRFAGYQWTNAGFAREFGWGTANDFTRPDTIARLNNPAASHRAFRQAIFERFRDPNYHFLQADAWPAVYGDGVTFVPTTNDPREWMAILPVQYKWLRQWADGDFVPDNVALESKSWTELTTTQQALGLDRAVLDETIGGPFHPGAEFSWPMRQPILYDAPFRLKRRRGPEPDFGDTLTFAQALQPGGALDGSGPGDITRWMAVPWQTDAASCLSGYRPWGGEYTPTFWPARVPNDVMTYDDYRILTDPTSTVSQREAAFSISRRRKWLRGIVYKEPGSYPPEAISGNGGLKLFVDQWPNVAIVTRLDGPSHQPSFPMEVWAETGRTIDQSLTNRFAFEPLWQQNPRTRR
jgi:L-Lysine epsilon oxidase N-terminal/L-lysine epsilon oxidase C-terminal domain